MQKWLPKLVAKILATNYGFVPDLSFNETVWPENYFHGLLMYQNIEVC